MSRPRRGDTKVISDANGLPMTLKFDGRGWTYNGGDDEERQQERARQEGNALQQWLDGISIAPPAAVSRPQAREHRKAVVRDLRTFWRSGAVGRTLRRHLDARTADGVQHAVHQGAPQRDRWGRVESLGPSNADPDTAGREDLRRRFKAAFPQLRIELPLFETGPKKGQVSHQALRDTLRPRGFGWCREDCTGQFPHGHPTKLERDQTPADPVCKTARLRLNQRR